MNNTPEKPKAVPPEAVPTTTVDSLKALGEKTEIRQASRENFDASVLGALAAQIEAQQAGGIGTKYEDLIAKRALQFEQGRKAT